MSDLVHAHVECARIWGIKSNFFMEIYAILLWCMWQKPENAVNRFCTLIHCLILETDQHKCRLFYCKLG